jgi:threonine/homoserine/homoserine lactone efflux protein
MSRPNGGGWQAWLSGALFSVVATAVVLVIVLSMSAAEYIIRGSRDPELSGVVQIVLGAFVAAVAAERVLAHVS